MTAETADDAETTAPESVAATEPAEPVAPAADDGLTAEGEVTAETADVPDTTESESVAAMRPGGTDGT